MTEQEVKAYLDGLPLSDRVKAAAWDAVYANTGDDADIQQRLDALPIPAGTKAQLWEYAHAPIDEEQAQPEGSALGRFVSGAGQELMNIPRGLAQLVTTNPIDTARSIYQAHADQFGKASQAFQEGRTTEALGHGAAGVLPLIGPMAANIGEGISETGDVATGVGRAATAIGGLVAGPAAVRGAGRVVGKTAKPLVRSAIKPTVTAMRQQAGASVAGINSIANRLTNFIVENGIASREAAQQLVSNIEGRIQQVVGQSTKTTDAPQRARRYLSALETSAKKQGLHADDVAVIRAKANELLTDSPLSEDVVNTVMQPSPSGLVDQYGKPVMVPTQVTSRALRTDVMPDEALAIGRASSKWGNKKQWGEQKSASKEADKAVERATRDATKAAVPEAKPLLQKQGQAIQAREALGRKEFREANREPVSPFDVTTAAAEIGTGRLPVLSVARHVLRENKLRLGVWAKQLERAVANHDEAAAAVILDRLGLARAATSPSGSRANTGPQTPVPLPAY